MKKTLHLTVSRKWFEMIAAGIKKEDYRELKKHWKQRFFNKDGTKKEFDLVCLRNGYGPESPYVVTQFKGIRTGMPNPEWAGEFSGKTSYIIGLGKIVELER